MKTYFGIDWLSFTHPLPEDTWARGSAGFPLAFEIMKELFAPLVGRAVSTEPVKPARAYEYGFVDLMTSARFSLSFRPGQGVMAVFSGSSLKLVPDHLGLLMRAHSAGWKLTRVDASVDVMQSGVSVEQFASAWWEKYSENQQRRTGYIDSPGGDTFSIGSRSSDKYVRVYDKAAEQGVEADWVRYELECKGDVSRGLLEVMRAQPTAVVRLMLDYIGMMESPVMQEVERAWANLEVLLPSPVPTKTDREKWLMTTVLNSVDALFAEDQEAAGRFIEAALNLWKTRAQTW